MHVLCLNEYMYSDLFRVRLFLKKPSEYSSTPYNCFTPSLLSIGCTWSVNFSVFFCNFHVHVFMHLVFAAAPFLMPWWYFLLKMLAVEECSSWRCFQAQMQPKLNYVMTQKYVHGHQSHVITYVKINIILRIDLFSASLFNEDKAKSAERSLEEENHPVHFTIMILTQVRDKNNEKIHKKTVHPPLRWLWSENFPLQLRCTKSIPKSATDVPLSLRLLIFQGT